MTHFLGVCPQWHDTRTLAGSIYSEGVSAALESALGTGWCCHWETALGRTGIPFMKLGGGERIGLGEGVLGGTEEQMPDGVIEGERQKLVFTMECGRTRTDNDKGAIKERAEEKEDKYHHDHSARTLLLEGLRTALGLDWNVRHVSFIA
eukprot:3878726-Rhodomonas_salina.1